MQNQKVIRIPVHTMKMVLRCEEGCGGEGGVGSNGRVTWGAEVRTSKTCYINWYA